jgi:biopolymer transport protein ExbD
MSNWHHVSLNDEPEVMMDINTTPLIDVMLVLLIMLIITIPIQLHAVNMDAAAANTTVTDKPKVVHIDIDARSQTRWNQQPVADRTALLALLQEASRQQPQPELHIRADGHAKYEAVAAVLAGARREGVQKIGIVGTAQFAER